MPNVNFSPDHLATVAAKGSVMIRELTEKVASLEKDNDDLRTKIAMMEREAEISKIAAEMEEKGLNAQMSLDEKLSFLRKHANLDAVKDAVKWAAASHIPIASVSDTAGRRVVDPLTSYCLGGE